MDVTLSCGNPSCGFLFNIRVFDQFLLHNTAMAISFMKCLSAGSTDEKSSPPDNYGDKTWPLNCSLSLLGVAFKSTYCYRKKVCQTDLPSGVSFMNY